MFCYSDFSFMGIIKQTNQHFGAPFSWFVWAGCNVHIGTYRLLTEPHDQELNINSQLTNSSLSLLNSQTVHNLYRIFSSSWWSTKLQTNLPNCTCWRHKLRILLGKHHERLNDILRCGHLWGLGLRRGGSHVGRFSPGRDLLFSHGRTAENLRGILPGRPGHEPHTCGSVSGRQFHLRQHHPRRSCRGLFQWVHVRNLRVLLHRNGLHRVSVYPDVLSPWPHQRWWGN